MIYEGPASERDRPIARRRGSRGDQWERIKDLLPGAGRGGWGEVTARDHGLFIDAVLCREHICFRSRNFRMDGPTPRSKKDRETECVFGLSFPSKGPFLFLFGSALHAYANALREFSVKVEPAPI